ncbi:hypothetical protein JCM10207_002399 [Rhodosporidiobolus poonsookiae]
MPPQAGGSGNKRAYTITWRNHQARKNKSWENDGWLLVDGQAAIFSDEDGKLMAQKTLLKPLKEEEEIKHGQREFKVVDEISLKEYYAAVKGEHQALGAPGPATPAPRPGFFTRPGAAATTTPRPAARTPQPQSAARAQPAAATPDAPGDVAASAQKKWLKPQDKMQKPFKPVLPNSVKRSPSVDVQDLPPGRRVGTPIAGPSRLSQQLNWSAERKDLKEKGRAKVVDDEEDEMMQQDEDGDEAVENSSPNSQDDRQPAPKKRRVDASNSAAQRIFSGGRTASRSSQAVAEEEASVQTPSRQSSSTSSASRASADTPALPALPPSRPGSRPKPWDVAPRADASTSRAAPPQAQPLFRRNPSPPPAAPSAGLDSPVKAVKPEPLDDDEFAMELDAGMSDAAGLEEVAALEASLSGDAGGAGPDEDEEEAASQAADDSGCFESDELAEEVRAEKPGGKGTGKAKEGPKPREEGRKHSGSPPASSARRSVDNEDEDEGMEAEAEKAKPVKKRRFSCQWRKHIKNKKQPVWTGDGVLTLEGGNLTLKNQEDNKWLAQTKVPADQVFEEGLFLRIGSYEMEIDKEILEKTRPIKTAPAPTPKPGPVPPRATPQPFKPPTSSTGKAFKPPSLAKATNPLAVRVAARAASEVPQPAPAPSTVKAQSFFLPGGVGSGAASKLNSPVPSANFAGRRSGPKHDPTKEGALVMRRPDPEHERQYNKKGFPVVDVVIDPILSDKLRDHQKEGVIFMYECVMGMRTAGQGCILADDMGLGKTLQAISLIYTLLKQNPYQGDQAGVIQRAMIVCPVTLLKNWAAEIKKWLGRDKLRVFVADNTHSVSTFAKNKSYDVLIVGYEKLRTAIDDVKYAVPPVGLIICDEGHRLKSTGAKVTKALQTLSCMRRVILSGTPIQNNLGEFFAMMDFVNPGLFQDAAYFKKNFEQPILQSRQPNARPKEKEAGQAASELLSDMQRNFVLRRTNEVNLKHLPPKIEYSVFVVPTTLEVQLYRRVLGTSSVRSLLEGHGRSDQLSLLTMLRKLVNTPGLLMNQAQTEEGCEKLGEDIVELLPQDINPWDLSLSAKFTALRHLLEQLRETTDEKVVIISNFTTTLDIIEKHCKKAKYPYCRLDGATPPNDRIPMVEGFNRGSHKNNFVFLLSSKSGGTGLNIIGASRLVMLDPDWNPSSDAQAMARIHREGQKRTCVLYRLFTTGTIDEKIFQRQITKLALSSSIMGEEGGPQAKESDTFSNDELRAIFTLHDDSAGQTHDLLGCRCHFGEVADDSSTDGAMSESEAEEEAGFLQASQWQDADLDKRSLKQRRNLSVLKSWTHYNCSDEASIEEIEDDLLRSVVYSCLPDGGDFGEDDHAVPPQGNGELWLRGGQLGWVFGKKTGTESAE